MINAGVQSLFDDYKLMNDPTVTVNVNVKPVKLTQSLSSKILQEIHRVSANTRLPEVEDLEAEDIYKYICTLVAMRVWHTSELTDKTSLSYKVLQRNVAIPVMVYQMLILIGEAYDRDFSIKFKPVYSIEDDNLLSPSAMLVISDILSRLEMNGMKVVYGMPRDYVGSLEFMALRHFDDIVKGYRHDHSIFGFYASFFEMKVLEEVVSLPYHVTYGCDSDFETYISRVMNKFNC